MLNNRPFHPATVEAVRNPDGRALRAAKHRATFGSGVTMEALLPESLFELPTP